MAKPTKPNPQHHYVRTFLAALCGMIAMTLVSASILVVWADRTLTDNATYVATVGPVIGRPELQEFVAGKIADSILQQQNVDDVAAQLLTPEQRAGKTPEQLKTLVTTAIHDRVVAVLRSPQVQSAWKSTNQSAQASLIRQLDAGSDPVKLDLTPLVTAVLAQLQQQNLVPVKDALDLPAGAAQVTLTGGGLKQVRNTYHAVKATAPIVVLLTLVFAALSVWASVHHAKTLRRMLVGTGVSALLVAAAIALPGWVHVPATAADPSSQQLALALTATLLHGLQVACLWLGLACVGVAIGSKLYTNARL